MLDDLFSTEAMRLVFSDRERLQAMLDFEAALARAAARCGVIPATAVAAIEAECRAESYDLATLARDAAHAGNAAIPMVKALTARVAATHEGAARYVHWGATSQDAMDTGLVLQLRAALVLFEADLERLANVAAGLAEKHKHTLLAGRTWLQQGLPTTFGLKAAGWLSALERHRGRLAELRARLLVLQFGGAVGTLASLGSQGLAVARALAEELQLALPDLPWHTQRDRIAEVAVTLGLIVGTLGKIARDISLLMQSEIDEACEPDAPGRGGSSSMPQKRNPVSCAIVLAAATRVPGLASVMLAAMVQEHERGLGNWAAEWATLPEICRLAAGALSQTLQAVEGLEVDAERMRDNLDHGGGQIYAAALASALAPHLGAQRAHDLVEKAARRARAEGRHLREVFAELDRSGDLLSRAELERAFDPAQATGSAGALVERALAARIKNTN